MIQYSHGATSEWREHTLISHIDERQTETESVRERNMSDCAIEFLKKRLTKLNISTVEVAKYF